jgi:hypothetical protein
MGTAGCVSAPVPAARFAVVFAYALVLWPAVLLGEAVAVRYPEGIVHGFLILRALNGTALASGDLIQTSRGDRVTVRLIFRFKDGSVQDETAVYAQSRTFRLISNHLIQKGPAFPTPLEMTLSRDTGRVTVRYADHGEQKVADEQMELPPDLANGMILTLLKNVGRDQPALKMSMVAATPKPRLVKLEVASAGEDDFHVGGSPRKATHYVVKVEIGGLAGLVAPLLGKDPPDSHVWILRGEAPAFVRSQQPLYLGGPMVRIELTSPVWPRSKEVASKPPAAKAR